jgi:hypothetical protein
MTNGGPRVPVAEPGRSTKVGNIRWGGRHPTKGTPQGHDHFRLTSVNREALERVADGAAEVTVWDRSRDDRPDEFETHLPHGHQLHVMFEVSHGNFRSGFEWGQGTEWRWCDGRTCSIRSEPEGGDDSGGREEIPCVCAADIVAGRTETLSCSRNTVMRVTIPGVEGHWLIAGGSRIMQERFSTTMVNLWAQSDDGEAVPLCLEVTQHEIPMRGGKRRRGWLPSLTVESAARDAPAETDAASVAYNILSEILDGATVDQLAEWREEFARADKAGELSNAEKRQLVAAAKTRHQALANGGTASDTDEGILTPADLPF